ncbi:MAG: hypothetical protein BV459_03920 [Thermoplasmata archaeon M11B2D]|nr:MAG: hypothetical protein BV459_03920 [Thermoplasmata archaeon M11B2D]
MLNDEVCPGCGKTFNRKDSIRAYEGGKKVFYCLDCYRKLIIKCEVCGEHIDTSSNDWEKRREPGSIEPPKYYHKICKVDANGNPCRIS